MDVNVNLCSGGIDSYLAWKLEVPAAENVFVRIGHRYQEREAGAVAMLAQADPRFSCTVLEGPPIGSLETPSGIIPLRNALLVLTAAAHVGSRPGVSSVNVWLGALAGEINSDKSDDFCRAVQRTLNASWIPQYWTQGVNFFVGSPVRRWTKAELLRRYADAGFDVAVLRHTRSCYDAGTRDDRDAHCGDCTACFKRWVAFRAAGIPDPTHYAQPPHQWAGAAEARQKSLDGTYDPLRSRETLAALEGVA